MPRSVDKPCNNIVTSSNFAKQRHSFNDIKHANSKISFSDLGINAAIFYRSELQFDSSLKIQKCEVQIVIFFLIKQNIVIKFVG